MLHHLFRTGLIALSVTVALPATGPAQKYSSPAPTASELPEAARFLLEHSPAIARIWPGFWSASESFLLLSPPGGGLLAAGWRPPAGFEALRTGTTGGIGLYRHDGPLPGIAAGTFPGTLEIGGNRVYALPPMGSTLTNRANFYVHEAFHFYQRGQAGQPEWTVTAEDSIGGLSPTKAIKDPVVLENDEVFVQATVTEAELLLRAAGEADRERMRALVAEYLEQREARLRGREDVVAVERRYERREGTAQYVGCQAVAGFVFDPDPGLLECLGNKFQARPGEDAFLRMMRWRLYSTGGLIAFLLDRLGAPEWRSKVTSGIHLDEQLALRVSIGTSP